MKLRTCLPGMALAVALGWSGSHVLGVPSASANSLLALANAEISPPLEVVEAEVNDAIEAFRLGMVEGNPGLIMAFSSPDLSFGHSNGVVQTREEFAEVVRSGAEVFKRVDLTDRRLKVLGNTAIERHHFSADIIYEGKLMNFELEVLEVWQKSGDYWRLVVRQAFKT